MKNLMLIVFILALQSLLTADSIPQKYIGVYKIPQHYLKKTSQKWMTLLPNNKQLKGRQRRGWLQNIQSQLQDFCLIIWNSHRVTFCEREYFASYDRNVFFLVRPPLNKNVSKKKTGLKIRHVGHDKLIIEKKGDTNPNGLFPIDLELHRTKLSPSEEMRNKKKKLDFILDQQKRMQKVTQLAKMLTEDELLKGIESKDWMMQKKCVGYLGLTKKRKYFDKIAPLLQSSSNEAVRSSAATALKHLGDRRAIPYLMTRLKAPNLGYAVEALSVMHALTSLTNVLNWTNRNKWLKWWEENREAVLNGTYQFPKHKPKNPWLVDRSKIEKLLKSKLWTDVEKAIGLIVRQNEKDAAILLRPLLFHKYSRIRTPALKALSKTKDKRLVGDLIRMLKRADLKNIYSEEPKLIYKLLSALTKQKIPEKRSLWLAWWEKNKHKPEYHFSKETPKK